jgi:hypothetical protein
MKGTPRFTIAPISTQQRAKYRLPLFESVQLSQSSQSAEVYGQHPRQ